MKKKIELSYEIVDGFRYVCEFKGSVEEYAMMWLDLSNKKRYYHCCEKLENNDGNDVFITVTEEQNENFKWDELFKCLGLTLKEKEVIKVVQINGDLPLGDDSLWDSEFVIGEIF